MAARFIMRIEDGTGGSAEASCELAALEQFRGSLEQTQFLFALWQSLLKSAGDDDAPAESTVSIEI